MELKRKQLKEYRMLQSSVQQFEQQIDLIIPDVNPDALTVLGVWGRCAITEQQLRKDRVTAAGTVDFTLLYRPENGGNTISLKGNLNFQEMLECKGAEEENLLFLRAEVMELRGKILNSRKIGIHCRVVLYAWVYQHSSHLLTEGVESKPEEGIQQRLIQNQVHRMVAVLEKTQTIHEEVRLGDGAAQVQLIHSTLQWSAEDVRMLNKKLMVRGAVQVRLLVLAEGETMREMEYALPFSQIVESNEVRPDCSAVLRYATGKQQLQLERREDGLFLACDLRAKIMVEVYREQRETVVADLYSTRYHTLVKTEPIPACGCKPDRISTAVRETVKMDAVVHKVLQWNCIGAWAEVSDGKIKGTYTIAVLWEDETGNKTQTCFMLRDEQQAAGLCSGAVGVVVHTLTVTATGVGMKIESQVQYEVHRANDVRCAQVVSCELETSRPRTGYVPGTLLLRTVGVNESTWDLARDYGTTESAILSANHLLPDQMLEKDQLVMIPVLRK